MAALSALSIDNLFVELDGFEIPAMDGSAKEFFETLRAGGVVVQKAERRVTVVEEPFYVMRNDQKIQAVPYDGFYVEYHLDYDHPFIGTQTSMVDFSNQSVVKDLMSARTFCLQKEAAMIQAAGLGLGANYQNTLVVSDHGVINNALRYPKEFAMHKLLDLVGDLYIGGPVQGAFIAFKSGHALNQKMVVGLKQMAEDARVINVNPSTSLTRRLFLKMVATGAGVSLLNFSVEASAQEGIVLLSLKDIHRATLGGAMKVVLGDLDCRCLLVQEKGKMYLAIFALTDQGDALKYYWITWPDQEEIVGMNKRIGNREYYVFIQSDFIQFDARFKEEERILIHYDDLEKISQKAGMPLVIGGSKALARTHHSFNENLNRWEEKLVVVFPTEKRLLLFPLDHEFMEGVRIPYKGVEYLFRLTKHRMLLIVPSPHLKMGNRDDGGNPYVASSLRENRKEADVFYSEVITLLSRKEEAFETMVAEKRKKGQWQEINIVIDEIGQFFDKEVRPHIFSLMKTYHQNALSFISDWFLRVLRVRPQQYGLSKEIKELLKDDVSMKQLVQFFKESMKTVVIVRVYVKELKPVVETWGLTKKSVFFNKKKLRFTRMI